MKRIFGELSEGAIPGRSRFTLRAIGKVKAIIEKARKDLEDEVKAGIMEMGKDFQKKMPGIKTVDVQLKLGDDMTGAAILRLIGDHDRDKVLSLLQRRGVVVDNCIPEKASLGGHQYFIGLDLIDSP